MSRALLSRPFRLGADRGDRRDNGRTAQLGLAGNEGVAAVAGRGALACKGRVQRIADLGEDRVDVDVLAILPWEFDVGHQVEAARIDPHERARQAGHLLDMVNVDAVDA